MGDPRENTPDYPQAELGSSPMWLELGSNPQWWDDKRFRALKISDLDNLAQGPPDTAIGPQGPTICHCTEFSDYMVNELK